MRKWILKGTTLKIPFHIALFRMKLSSNETQITLHFIQGCISAMPEIRADLFLAISKTGMCLLTSLFFLNVLLLWFPAGQGLKKVGFSKKKIKLAKILYESE